MTKEELLEYIASFGKKPGEFTDDEVYAIGKAHKTLPRGDRNWNDLAAAVGSPGRGGVTRTGESLRTYVKQREYDDGSITRNERLLSGKAIGDLSPDELEGRMSDLKRELYIQEVRTRDEANAYRATLRDEARIRRFEEGVSSAIRGMTPLPLVDDYEPYGGDAEAVLLYSDLHIGAQIDNFYNKYDVKEANARVSRLVSRVIRHCRLNGVRRLNFTNLGDLIAGNIHITSRLMQEIDVIDQVIQASEITANALNRLQAAIPEVVYRSCLDNHSRVTPNLKEHIEKESFARLIDFYLRTRLADTNVRFADDNLDDNIGLIKLQNGRKLVFVHGHQDNVNASVQNYTAATKGYVDYVCLGHYHSTKAKTFQNSKVFVNGSIIGTDDYAMSRRLFGVAEQTLLVFDGDDLVNVTIDLSK